MQCFSSREDTDVTLEAYSNRLSNVIFHEKLGSVAQKIDRLMSVANSIEEHRTIALCKADLVSQMVGEFSELQELWEEFMPQHKAKVLSFARQSRNTINRREQVISYQIHSLVQRVSFFDKLDTLVGFLGSWYKNQLVRKTHLL